MQKQLSNRKDVAKHFAVTEKTVKNWEQQNKIKVEATINGRPKYILQDCIDALTKKANK